MDAFVEGLLAGYGIAIPVGAIAILIMETALRRGFRLGFMAGAGAAAADGVYALIAAIAGSALAPFVSAQSQLLTLISGGVLVGIGLYGLYRATRPKRPSDAMERESAKSHHVFFTFLALTIINPLTVVYFTALIVGLGENVTPTIAAKFNFVIAAFIASLSWQTLLALFGSAAHRVATPKTQIITSIFGNLIVIGLGIRLVLRAV